MLGSARSGCSTCSPRSVIQRALGISRGVRLQGAVQSHFASSGTAHGATPAQIALTWLLAQGEDIASIPGTRRVARVEENTAADGIELSDDQLERLNNLTTAVGERHDEANMASIDR